MKWIVEDDENLIKEAKATLESMKIKEAKVVPSSQYTDVLNDKSVRIGEYWCNHASRDLLNVILAVIISGPVVDRPRRASEALKAHKDVLCDRPIAMTIDSARELFALGRRQKQVLMTLLPGRPGKSFSAVVMSLFSSASKIVCERVIPDGYKHPLLDKKINPSDPSVEAMFIDTILHDCFAVNFCMCMRPTEVSSCLVSGKEHKAEITVLYPNGCVYTIFTALGLESVDTQSFSLSGERLVEMRRVDHMHVFQHEITQDKHQESKVLRFTQEYEAARADALEQMYAASSGAKAIASRVRPQLIEQNVVDCLRIAQACTKALRTGQTVPIEYW
ncbi:hypothetical protein GUITHDRAFT_164650 [Guillardia theta CCMP2712]|uniref:Gfo/Idh/MocA-like oxidoreductase N-terminal domain-containing protein n=1 Tax=Guillardia theta (strain CCMP2712) TaxID=905079 RepID=L1IWJ9_GUITC|nr:hypothetical protein GUITHDRAFT_164650 [Guillardia theta CCMP2712]EKX40616.1 hypothetical protein GUITHDRAFT_164650 [Guillardia theta CCMP2712]|eukprot:XP_005827596.1 hypothetical protein GUITHDRAFT_164650 [Guillardia theta CCMP2712]